MPSRRTRATLRQFLVDMDHQLRAELRKEVEDTAQEMKDYFLEVTRTWKTKIHFRRTMKVSSGLIEATVNPVGKNKKIWFYLDKGTGKWGDKHAPYPIRPKLPGYPLRFQSGYSPRTSPPVAKGALPSHSGSGRRSGEWVNTYEVMHPGIEPRKFGESFNNKLKPDFARRTENAIRRATRR